MSELGDRIRIRRKELGLTLRQMGSQCSLSASFLSDLERGKRSLGADSLLSIAQVLGLPVDQLMTGNPARQIQGVAVQLPQSLMRMATQHDLPFRQALCLYWMARSIMDHRINERRQSLEKFDWLLFYQSVKDHL